MKIYTITARENQFEQWNDSVGNEYELVRLSQDKLTEELERLKSDSVVILDLVSCKELFLAASVKRKEIVNRLRIAALSNIPNIHECLGLLAYNVKAYGHNLMDAELFNEMLSKVLEGKMWFPELIMEDVIRVALYSEKQPQKMDSLDILTPREQEVAYGVALGKSNKEIAQKLSVSADTIKQHMHHIYQKLDIDNRVALALKIKL